LSIITQIQAITLSELTGHISDVISDNFAGAFYWVVADISNHTFYPNKDHHYFELVEKDESGNNLIAKMQAVAWRTGAGRIRNFEAITGQRFKNGIRVSLKVQVDYHVAFGLKLIVLDIDPAYTIGQLELHRQATIRRLLTECSGYVKQEGGRFITKNNSLSHQLVIKRIAVVSSNSSAGYQDFMHTLLHNKFGYRFTVNSYFITVQGESNAEAASKKIEEICASGIPFDAIVIIRGGGADTDFLIFDQFILCQTVARLSIPVITGIGHLKNQSLVDLMAHTATNAPTKAAEFIVAHNHSFETAVLTEQKRVVIKAQQILGQHQQAIMTQNAAVARKARALLTGRKEDQEKLKEKVVAQSKRLIYRQRVQLMEVTNKALNKPQIFIANQKNELRNSLGNLKWFAGKYIANQKSKIGYMESICRMMSPVNLLKKGFALVYYQERIITEGSALTEGAEIIVRLQDAEVLATVQQKRETNGDTFNL
jgi:exodeoxyribonuclease VII large subunit